MPTIKTPRFIIPIDAAHITEALETARPDIESFRKKEMAWLDENNPFFKASVGEWFSKMIRRGSPELGDAMMAGSMLAHHAVRLCVDGSGADYDVVARNHVKNVEADRRAIGLLSVSTPLSVWNTEPVLKEVFGDDELVAALLDIRHDMSRDAAAVTLGYFCLEEVPPPVSAHS